MARNTHRNENICDLRFNRIRDVPDGFFKNHKGMVSLLLNNNFLTALTNATFEGLYSLQNLYLYKNRIKYIESGTFRHMARLERLYLQSNELQEFKAATFSDLPSLDRLYLYNNHIKQIPKGAFNHLPKLRRLRLDHNALICDCKLAWLSKMLTKTDSLQASAHCAKPTEMSGRSIIGMAHKHFHCEPPKIVENPEDIQITIGGTAIFKCSVQSDEEPSIVWMKENEELIPDNKKYKLMDNGTLMIQNTEETDGGYYECFAKNPEGEVRSRPARMVVDNGFQSENQVIEGSYEMPKLILAPKTTSVTPGTRQVRLDCRAIGNPPPRITWSHNGREIAPSYRHLTSPDGSLTILDIEESDHGSYRCEASNYNGRVSAEANILIKVAPIFSIQPENINVITGKSIRLVCVASGTPVPQMIWYKDDLEIVPSDDRVYFNADRTTLEIINAIETDSGLYVCEAKNELGSREVSARVKVSQSDDRPPKLIYKPYNIEAFIGSTIELPCRAQGDPNPGITWQKDGARMQRTGRFKIGLTGNLYIYKVAPEDQGIYECLAQNVHGRDSATGYLTVKEDPAVRTGAISNIGDKFIKIAFTEASNEIDKAINNTIENFLHNKSPSSSELFRIVRYPDAPARELARAAEVYERTLVNIRKHINKGQLQMNNTQVFDYHEVLSPQKLDLIARLSGCMAHREGTNCSDMCFHSKYRSIDGRCNNLQHPTWGSSLTGFRRILKPIYEDGFSKPVGWDKGKLYNGYPKPASRKVSTSLISTSKITPDAEITHMVMQWGQFLDHDLDHATPSVSSESWDGIDCKKSCDYAAPCYPMDVPEDDPRIKNRRCIDFVRSSAICGSGMTSIFFDSVQHREQINQLTSYIDGSMIYGFSDELAREIRDLDSPLGRLKEGVVFPGRKPLLPYATGPQGMDCRRNLSESDLACFLAGDIRANEQSGLTAMHTVWMREHNRLAKELRYLNPHWDSDMLYHEARKIVGAAIQHITYKHWMPFIVGPEGLNILGKYEEYNPQLNPSISNVFATAALRFGHTLINPVLNRLDWEFKPIREGHLPLHKAFFSPWRIVDEGGIDPLMRGMFVTAAKKKLPKENLNTELTERLFQTAHAVALDLAAMNIHRSRDHALPGYIAFRNFCNMSKVSDFEDLATEISDPDLRQKLKELYGHPENIDVWVGGILEDPVRGGRVGPLFRCLLLEQFRRLRDGDRFWYENPSVFKPEQLVQIKQYSLARVLCDNGDNITRITENVFVLPELQEGIISCEKIPKVDLKLWSECCTDCRYTGQLNTISRLNARSRRNAETEKKHEKELRQLRNRVSELEDRLDKALRKIEL
ncbi:peroxidasin isoform X2 [Anthonomus grandis grandis]|uniref:peroxidasin isoform X2 n=1 Tax=Anthonomus grandis grandis TaxID=2921223 RepID=UPI0021655F9D|nr:peroxidasin isoform X2 [Anthonomus grandis grandis]